MMKECHTCGLQRDIQRHHIDFNRKNNHPSNLVWLCKTCHTEVTQCGYTSREELDAIREQVKARDPSRFTKLPLFED